MKRWMIALIALVIWFVLIIGAAYIHIDIILGDSINPQRDAELSQSYGMVFGFGIVVIFALSFLKRK